MNVTKTGSSRIEFKTKTDEQKMLYEQKKEELLRIQEIRAPKRDFDGGNELFIENPIEHARSIGLLR